jgi:hypothetical protein
VDPGSVIEPDRTGSAPERRSPGRPGPEGITTAPEPAEGATGRTEPRLRTTLPEGRDYALGRDAIEFARDRLGIELYPWQELVLLECLATVGGRLVSDTALVSVARQQGKTVVLQALVGWWLVRRSALEEQPQAVLHAGGNKLVTVEHQWEEVADKLAEQYPGAVASYYRSSGRKELVLHDGSRYSVKSTSGSGSSIHGLTIDLAVLDEVWRLDEEVCDQAVLPTMMTRRDPLRFMVSTAGDRESVYMRQLREQLLAEVEDGAHSGATLLEWSPPDGITGEAAWEWSCPSMGYGNVTAERLRSLAARMTPADAARALENRWTDEGASVWIRQGLWTRAAGPLPPEVPGATFAAVEAARLADDEEARYGIVTAWRSGPEQVAVRALEVIGEEAVWHHLEAERATHRATVLLPPGLFARHPFPDLTAAPVERRGSRELRATSDLVRWWLAEGRLVHDGGDALTAAVLNARRYVPKDGGGADLRAVSGTSIHLARALVWAAAEAARVPVAPIAPVLRLA